MMSKLTEALIYQKMRSCPADLSKITQLNITGRRLVDVSVIEELVGLEVISLSFNCISSLAYFKNCKNLRVLYLRQNNIQHLKEIKHLVHLPKLEQLTLAQNPCAEEPLYRFTVIKHLKHLTQLDDVPVLSEDRTKAELLGKNLTEEGSRSSTFCGEEDEDVKRLSCKLSEALKIKSANKIPRGRVNSEQFKSIGRSEETLFGIGHPSTSRLNTRRSVRASFADIRQGVPGESLYRRSHSLDRVFLSSRTDLHETTSQAVHDSEEPERTSDLVVAAVLMARNLDYSELQILCAEVTAMLEMTGFSEK